MEIIPFQRPHHEMESCLFPRSETLSDLRCIVSFAHGHFDPVFQSGYEILCAESTSSPYSGIDAVLILVGPPLLHPPGKLALSLRIVTLDTVLPAQSVLSQPFRPLSRCMQVCGVAAPRIRPEAFLFCDQSGYRLIQMHIIANGPKIKSIRFIHQ